MLVKYSVIYKLNWNNGETRSYSLKVNEKIFDIKHNSDNEITSMNADYES